MPLYQYRRESEEKTFLFIHVPKTGGTAIEDYFRNIGLASFYDPQSYRQIRPYLKLPPAHFDYEMCDRLFHLGRFYSFAIVRNPLHRMISEYKWAIHKTNLPDHVKKYSFSEFVEYAQAKYQEDENFLAGHLKPQHRFTGVKISKVFKYERGLSNIIKEVFRDVGLRINGNVSIPVINKSDDVQVKLADRDIGIIKTMYAEDFARFGYQIDRTNMEAGE
jgi:hypothetical protein